MAGLTLEQAKRLRRLIRAHAQAQVDLSWAGAGVPGATVAAEADALRLAVKLNNYITLLSERGTPT